MENDKAVKLITRLAEKTTAGEISWEELSEHSYVTSVAGRQIVIYQHWNEFGPHSEPDYFLQLIGDTGEVVDSFSDYELRPQFEESFRVMGKLWKEARRDAKGITQILDDVLRELDDI